jgi:hypothetical protein
MIHERFNQLETVENPWNRTSGIMIFFAITQEGVDQPFSSSNSTEMSTHVKKFDTKINYFLIKIH